MSKAKWIILGVFLSAVTLFACFFSCYIAGRNAERAANQQQLAAAEAELANERAQYQRFVETTEARVDSITAGLGNAVSLAANAVDRSQRIAIIFDAVDRALRELGVLTDE